MSDSTVRNSMVFAERQGQSLSAQGVNVNSFYLSTRTSLWGLLGEAARFRLVLRCFKPQVIHAHFGTVTALFAAIIAPRTPLVITYRGGDLNPAPALAPLAARLRSAAGRLLSQLAALRANRIVCVSKQLQSRLWWNRHRSVVLPSGVDPAFFFPSSQAGARRELGWDPQERVVLFNAGGPWWVKRPDLAEAAVRYAAQTVPRLRLAVTRGNLTPDRMPVWMNASDCLLLTSETEGSPTVIQEALACGLPIVTVDVGDIRDRLEGVEGVRLTARDPKALGAALAELLLKAPEPQQSQKYLSNGYFKVSEFSAHHIASQLRQIYGALVSHF